MTRVSRVSNRDIDQGVSRIGSVKRSGQSWTLERLPTLEAGSRGVIDVCVGLRVELGCREKVVPRPGFPWYRSIPVASHEGLVTRTGQGSSRWPRGLQARPGPLDGGSEGGDGNAPGGGSCARVGHLTGSSHGLTKWNERNRRSIRLRQASLGEEDEM
jgi:hypothetical protein